MFSLRPFRKIGKLTKLLYFVTTSEKKSKESNILLDSRKILKFIHNCSCTFNPILRGKLLAVIFQVQYDFCSLLDPTGFRDFKKSRAEIQNTVIHFDYLICDQ